MGQPDLLNFPVSSDDDKRTKANEKSPNALRTISEAAELIDVPQHVLRFWETKFSQIKPLKRNGGRRFYRPADIEVLQQIKFLLYRQGYTIKGAKKAIDDLVHQRGENIAHWSEAFPPANVNDNAEPAIQAANEVLTLSDVDAEPSAKVVKLKTLRSELLSLRDELAPFIERTAS